MLKLFFKAIAVLIILIIDLAIYEGMTAKPYLFLPASGHSLDEVEFSQVKTSLGVKSKDSILFFTTEHNDVNHGFLALTPEKLVWNYTDLNQQTVIQLEQIKDISISLSETMGIASKLLIVTKDGLNKNIPIRNMERMDLVLFSRIKYELGKLGGAK